MNVRSRAKINTSSRNSRGQRGSKASGNQSPGAAISFIAGANRVSLISTLFVLAAIGLSVRLFYVQVIQHSAYETRATSQHAAKQELAPHRGEIYVHDKTTSDGITPFATNRDTYEVYANPKQFAKYAGNIDAVANAIAPLISVPVDTIKQRLGKSDDIYEPLSQQVSEQAVVELKKIQTEQKFKGIYWVPLKSRYYPEGPISGSVTGFVGYVGDERKGQYGIEGYYNDELAGTEGAVTDLAQGKLNTTNGDTVILTIDKNIQYKACQILQKAVDKHGGKKGTVIVENPKTGAIMAICNVPMYDPNTYAQVTDLAVFQNTAVTDQYEPGSVFKVITMAAGVNEQKISPYTTYTDTGVAKIAGFEIRNSDRKAHGVVDMKTVLEKSLNTGTVFIEQQVGHEKWQKYVEAFGFGKKTGIEIAGEGNGEISAVKKHKDIYGATTSYGQGLLVTPIQLVQAFSAIANNGVMMKPHFVDRVVKSNGYQEVHAPEVIGQPVTRETANTVAAMMVGVIDKQASKSAVVDGYYLSGKTGTAQMPREDGKGYDEFRHKDTFMGFGPLKDPQFVILAKIDEPGTQWAEGSVGPIFGELAKYIIDYLQIPPDRPEAK